MSKSHTSFLRILWVSLVCMASYTSIAQIPSEGIPEITPMNPDTATLGRYGNIPISGASGQMSYGVPIYTIGVDGNSWPIHLSYNYGGLIAEGKPSIMGLGWSLSAHGAVSREVRGLPDGHENGYYGANNIGDLIPDFGGGSYDIDIVDYMKFQSGEYDSEVDKYTLNAAGIQFSFKLRYDAVQSAFVPYYLHKHNYQLEVVMDTGAHHKVDRFILTDDKGIIYHFEDQETSICEGGGTGVCPEDNANSWLLSRIAYPNGEEISFEYTQDTFFNWNFGASGIAAYRYGSDTETNPPGMHPIGDIYGDVNKATQVDRLILTSINFPKGSLDLNTTTIDGHKLYSDILVKDPWGTVINTYDFTYGGHRDLLMSIDKNTEDLLDFRYYGDGGDGSIGTIPEFYEGSTNKPLAQDSWRFYNGVFNTHLYDMGIGGIQADRSSSLFHTRLGALKEIVYPTGGHTDIIYAQNQARVPYVPGSDPGGPATGYDHNELIGINVSEDNQDYEDERTFTFTQPVIAEISHRVVGDLSLGNYIRLSIEETTGAYPDLSACYSFAPIFNSWYYQVAEDARNKLVDSEGCSYYPNPPMVPFFLQEYGPDGCPYPTNPNNQHGCQGQFAINQSHDTGGAIVIMPGTYKFKVTTYPPGHDPETQSGTFAYGNLTAEIRLKWKDPVLGENNAPPLYQDQYVGGIRVAKVTDTPEDGEPVETTYSYIGTDGFSSGVLNHDPTERHQRSILSLDDNQQYIEEFIYTTAAFNMMSDSDGLPVYYERVISQKGDAKTIQNYAMPQQTMGDFKYPGLPEGKDRSGAMLIRSKAGRQETQQSYFKNRLPTQYQGHPELPNSENGYSHDFNDDHPWSFKLHRKKNLVVNWYSLDYPAVPSTPIQVQAYKALHQIYPYREIDMYPQLVETVTTADGVESTVTYSYDEKDQLSEQETLTSEGDTVLSQFYYPYSSEVSGESQYQLMTSKNQINQAVQQTSSRNGTLLATQKTDFIPVGLGYKPNSIKAAKAGHSLEERTRLEIYDSRSNLLQARTANGTPISYLWSYNFQYVVAKIEGATHSEAVSALASAGYSYNGNFQSASETSIRTAMDSVRNTLTQATITSYTYTPLIGVTSVTDPRGYTVYYDYDTQHRLEQVRDQDGNILSKNEYNYRDND